MRGWGAVKHRQVDREFGVSQTPIREALARLEDTGLVIREALKGYQVAPDLSERNISKMMDARLILEPALPHLAARRIAPEFLAELLVTVEGLDQSVELADMKPEDFRQYWASDDRFDSLIVSQSGNPFLESAYGALGGRFSVSGCSPSWATAGLNLPLRSGEIYDALVNANAEAAAERMRAHVQNAQGSAREQIGHGHLVCPAGCRGRECASGPRTRCAFKSARGTCRLRPCRCPWSCGLPAFAEKCRNAKAPANDADVAPIASRISELRMSVPMIWPKVATSPRRSTRTMRTRKA